MHAEVSRPQNVAIEIARFSPNDHLIYEIVQNGTREAKVIIGTEVGYGTRVFVFMGVRRYGGRCEVAVPSSCATRPKNMRHA